MREGEAGIATSCAQLAGSGIKQTRFSLLPRNQSHSRWLEQGKATAPGCVWAQLSGTGKHCWGVLGSELGLMIPVDPFHSGYSVVVLRVRGSTRIYLFPWSFSPSQGCLLLPSRWHDQGRTAGRDSGAGRLRTCPGAIGQP